MPDAEAVSGEHETTGEATDGSDTSGSLGGGSGADLRGAREDATGASLPQGVVITRSDSPGSNLAKIEEDQPAPVVHVRWEGLAGTGGAENPQGGSGPDLVSAGDQGGTSKDFQAGEAENDLAEARQEIDGSKEALSKLSGPNKARAAGVRTETETLERLLEEVGKLLSKGQPVPPGLAVSVTVRVELVQEAASQASDHADRELTDVLQQVLEKTRKAGKKLLSMNLHLFPVKEWQLGGEVSALFVKGTISVTFGSGASRAGTDPGSDLG